MFLGGALEKLKVDPEIEQFYEFKNAPDVYKRKDYSEPHARAMTELAESVWRHSIADIAVDRKMDPAAAAYVAGSQPVSGAARG